jgi:hypothetical protein
MHSSDIAKCSEVRQARRCWGRGRVSRVRCSTADHGSEYPGSTVGRNLGELRTEPNFSCRVAGVFTAQSGAPFTVNVSAAAGQNVSPIGLVSGNYLERPNLVGNPNGGPQTAAEWFNTAAFALPAQNTFGSAGRSVVTGPGLTDLDLPTP